MKTSSDHFYRFFVFASFICLLVGIEVPQSHGAATKSWFEINTTTSQADWQVIPVPRRSRITHGIQPRLYDHGDPTDFEQFALERINASRAYPELAAKYYGVTLNQGLAPDTISSSPKPPLAFNPQLIDAARGHSLWMLDTQRFSHLGKKTSTPKDRIVNAEYIFSGSWSCAENIGWSGTTGPFHPDRHLRTVLRGLFRSPGHRVNTLAEYLDEVGIGIFNGNMSRYKSVMVTENYARSSSTTKPLILGVVYNDVNANGYYDLGEGVEGVTLFLNDGDYFAVTSASGGFAFPMQTLKGKSVLIATGQGLPGFVIKSVKLKGHNVKVDLDISLFDQ
jgi:hypothetical protein